MNQIINKILGNKPLKKSFTIWYYQLPNQPERKLIKSGKYWTYIDNGTQIGSDTLAGAKGDIIYSGGKVRKELKELQ